MYEEKEYQKNSDTFNTVEDEKEKELKDSESQKNRSWRKKAPNAALEFNRHTNNSNPLSYMLSSTNHFFKYATDTINEDNKLKLDSSKQSESDVVISSILDSDYSSLKTVGLPHSEILEQKVSFSFFS
jgi:hypothetical protein